MLPNCQFLLIQCIITVISNIRYVSNFVQLLLQTMVNNLDNFCNKIICAINTTIMIIFFNVIYVMNGAVYSIAIKCDCFTNCYNYCSLEFLLVHIAHYIMLVLCKYLLNIKRLRYQTIYNVKIYRQCQRLNYVIVKTIWTVTMPCGIFIRIIN